jgi:hypothetical protein
VVDLYNLGLFDQVAVAALVKSAQDAAITYGQLFTALIASLRVA